VGQTNPDLLFIDLDAKDFASLRSFKLGLTATLKNIKQKIAGHPTVLWSGRGYHVIQPIDCPIALEDVKELAAPETCPSNKFLQFAERYLTAANCDNSNHPAIKSCMLRIPGSFNSKCKAVGIDAEVKILQPWDGRRPDYRLLLGNFYAYLVGQKRFKPVRTKNLVPIGDAGKIPWIERLLQTPIEDYRKHARDLILVPYLVVTRGIADQSVIENIVMHWADRCAELRRLHPSRSEFVNRVRSRTYEVAQSGIPPMRFETLNEKNPELWQKIKKLSVGVVV
jgi:hypothetical protein